MNTLRTSYSPEVTILSISILVGKAVLAYSLVAELPIFVLVPEKPADFVFHGLFLLLAGLLVYYDVGTLLALLVFFIPAFDIYYVLIFPGGDIAYANEYTPVFGLLVTTSSLALGYTVLQQILRVVYYRGQGQRGSIEFD